MTSCLTSENAASMLGGSSEEDEGFAPAIGRETNLQQLLGTKSLDDNDGDRRRAEGAELVGLGGG